jgi:Uma2 family endonuclease
LRAARWPVLRGASANGRVEVLSPSTRKIDRFTKLSEYRRHPSLRHILLIDPDAVAAKLYSRPDEGAWSDVDLMAGTRS